MLRWLCAPGGGSSATASRRTSASDATAGATCPMAAWSRPTTMPPRDPIGQGADDMAQGGPRLETMHFRPEGRVPNSRFPVLLYPSAVACEAGGDVTDAVEATFQRHDWLNNWARAGRVRLSPLPLDGPRGPRHGPGCGSSFGWGRRRGRLGTLVGRRCARPAGRDVAYPAGQLARFVDGRRLSRRPRLGPDPRRRGKRGRRPARRQVHRQPADPEPRPRHRRADDALARGAREPTAIPF